MTFDINDKDLDNSYLYLQYLNEQSKFFHNQTHLP